MTHRITTGLGIFLSLTLLLGGNFAYAQTSTSASASYSYKADASVKPVGFFDNVKLFFTLNPAKKAALLQDFSNRNFELAKQKLGEGNATEADMYFKKSDNNTIKATASISKIEDDEQQKEALSSIGATATTRATVLADVKAQVKSPDAKEAIEKALSTQVEVKSSIDEKIKDLLKQIADLEAKVKELQNSKDNHDQVSASTDPVVSASDSKFTIISPNGGETFKIGDKVVIKWKGGPEKSTVSFSLGKDHWSDTDAIILADNSRTENDGEYIWTISDRIEPGTYYLNGGNNHEGFWDHSDKKFTIIGMHDPAPGISNNGGDSIGSNVCNSSSTPSITVLSPNGGETYHPGEQITITWESTCAPFGFDIGLHFADGLELDDPQGGFSVLAWATPNDGVQVVTLPDETEFRDQRIFGMHYKVLIAKHAFGIPLLPADASDNLFSIQE